MTRLLHLAVASLALAPLLDPLPAKADESAIRAQIKRYEQALNRSDKATVMSLYSDDAVFMSQNSQPFVGRSDVDAAYDKVFAAIKLDITFEIDEVRELGSDWAFARTRSTGTTRFVGASAPARPEANQELFLLHRESDGQWRFARYIFSTTIPSR